MFDFLEKSLLIKNLIQIITLIKIFLVWDE